MTKPPKGILDKFKRKKREVNKTIAKPNKPIPNSNVDSHNPQPSN